MLFVSLKRLLFHKNSALSTGISLLIDEQSRFSKARSPLLGLDSHSSNCTKVSMAENKKKPYEIDVCDLFLDISLKWRIKWNYFAIVYEICFQNIKFFDNTQAFIENTQKYDHFSRAIVIFVILVTSHLEW